VGVRDGGGRPVARVEVVPGRPTAVAVHGEIDAASADLLDAAVTELRRRGCTEVVVDLAHVTFMDLSGLRVLHLAAVDGMSVVVRNPPRIVRRVIDLAGMADLLPIEPPGEVG